jgi:hypothetical protein
MSSPVLSRPERLFRNKPDNDRFGILDRG